MKAKWIVFGGTGLFVLALCAGLFFLAGLAGWLSFQPGDSSKPIKIALLPPLATPVSPAAAEPNENPAQVPAEPALSPSAEQPAAGDDVPTTTVAEVNVEEILGFDLPPNTVNSVTLAGVATRLVIPKISLDAPIVLSRIVNQTWEVDHLGQTVGHLEGTAPAGATSNFVLAGHVTLAETNGGPGPFFKLKELTPGDLIVVHDGDKQFEYVIDSFQTVDRTAVEVTFPTETAQITLLTCTNWSQDEKRYVNRLVVKGHLVKG